ncbi:transposase [Methylovirgula sp. 4M-Z18]|uniref:transposase n=1 Tax=Methylovirgula sp. 4M-Z18 TaxID=2293567 RepID=UPI000E2FAC0A|nr:transposase [Methylovirgula sp. 4M-Z18]RFB78896.1 hypothetical protein DYH55_13760 [Methylovirgula sp. 4M-Z18]
MSQATQALAEQFLSPEWKALVSPHDLFGDLEIKLIEALLNAELSHHLELDARAGKKNFRNGYWKRTIPCRDGATITIRIPRERAGRFEARLVPHHRRHFYGFTDRVLAIYAHGRDVAEIEDMLPLLYDLGLPRDLAPRITDAVLGIVRDWQERRLEPAYPFALFADLPMTTQERKLTQDRPVYYALGLKSDGTRDLLGLWVQDKSSDDIWQQMLTDLAARGLHRITAAVTGDLDAPPITQPSSGAPLPERCELHHVHALKELSTVAARQALVQDILRALAGGNDGRPNNESFSYAPSLASALV